MNFKDIWAEKQKETNEVLHSFLPREEGYQRKVAEAMNYSVMGGGKRIRPILLSETYRWFRGISRRDVFVEADQICGPFMAALEMIHSYSLVHDDLPAMDNDEYRRGRKTTHKVYGEAIAILAGDGLLNFAFETASGVLDEIAEDNQLTEEAKLILMKRAAKALKVLGQKAGISGMIGGQTADILAEEGKEASTEELLLFIHVHKTAALIQAAMMIGGILAGAGEEALACLEQAALSLGLAFQIQDDILDVTGSFEALGKPIGSDDKNDKLTYVSFRGLEQARREVAQKSEETMAILRSFGGENEFLLWLVETMIHRNH